MCPIDPTPHGAEVFHKPEKQFPEPPPEGKHEDQPDDAVHTADTSPQIPDPSDPSMRDRPAIPPSSELMGVDVEDEEDDPVVESGPLSRK